MSEIDDTRNQEVSNQLNFSRQIINMSPAKQIDSLTLQYTETLKVIRGFELRLKEAPEGFTITNKGLLETIERLEKELNDHVCLADQGV